MWIRHSDGTYSDSANSKNTARIIKTGEEFNIYIGETGSPVQRGYVSEKDAQLALDEFMRSELDAKEIQPPTTDEEGAVSTEEGSGK